MVQDPSFSISVECSFVYVGVKIFINQQEKDHVAGQADHHRSQGQRQDGGGRHLLGLQLLIPAAQDLSWERNGWPSTRDWRRMR